MSDFKGVNLPGVAILVSIWVSVIIAIFAIKSEARGLITTARITDTTIARHVSITRGYGGLGRFLVVHLTGPEGKVLSRCPGGDETTVCMRLDVRNEKRESSCPGIARNGTCWRAE